jgi:hypothetical protein
MSSVVLFFRFLMNASSLASRLPIEIEFHITFGVRTFVSDRPRCDLDPSSISHARGRDVVCTRIYICARQRWAAETKGLPLEMLDLHCRGCLATWNIRLFDTPTAFATLRNCVRSPRDSKQDRRLLAIQSAAIRRQRRARVNLSGKQVVSAATLKRGFARHVQLVFVVRENH